jgi:hypothetical protein
MAVNPLLRCIQSAVRANGHLEAMFGRLGSTEHPNGLVLSAYRNANRAMRIALREPSPVTASREVLSQLKYTIRTGVLPVMDSAAQFGTQEADRQLEYYQVGVPSDIPTFPKSNLAISAVIGVVDSQQAAIEAMIQGGIDPVMITGDQERQGALRAGDVLALASFWMTSLVWDSFSTRANRGSIRFQKQACAALDGRTTDCCLRVHGQIQPFDGKFNLTGTPRYADELDWPEFHRWCRTSVVLYDEGFDDGLTARMRDSARFVLEKRIAKTPWDQHPADAFVGNHR